MIECNSIENTNLIYYQRNKERIRVNKARNKYRNLSEEENIKKR